MSLFKHFATLLLLLLPTLSYAEDAERWYQVEIIVFSQNNPQYHESEQWPLNISFPDLEKSRELVKPRSGKASQTAPRPFSFVSSKKLKLGDTVRRIKKASDVELMLHFGWLQPGLPEKQAVPVHIYEGMLNKSNKAKASPRSSQHQHVEMGTPMKGTGPRLDGTLRLILSRYLHLESDLIWREPRPKSQPGLTEENTQSRGQMGLSVSENMDSLAPGGDTMLEDTPMNDSLNYQVFRMQQSRRMRSSEIHYIDHPRFGIVVLVTPFKLAQPE
ncbi:MAG: CsiV family protein [Pseudomonadota bacterium]